jgi:hypothetical protein
MANEQQIFQFALEHIVCIRCSVQFNSDSFTNRYTTRCCTSVLRRAIGTSTKQSLRNITCKNCRDGHSRDGISKCPACGSSMPVRL